MDALLASYASDSDESPDSPPPTTASVAGDPPNPNSQTLLPPPHVDLLHPPNHTPVIMNSKGKGKVSQEIDQPTTSNRRGKQRGRSQDKAAVSQELEVENEEVGLGESSSEERDGGIPVVTDVATEKSDVENDTEPHEDSYPGGPEDGRTLLYIRTHIADRIWRNDDREPLKCVSHGRTLRSDWLLCARAKAMIPEFFHRLAKVSYPIANRTVISAFVERWYPETNTFHLPVGELTITPDDVSALLGIPVMGAAVKVCKYENREAESMLLQELLGVDEESAEAELKKKAGGVVTFAWLSKNWGNIDNNVPDSKIKNTARAYMLSVLGSTLFADKSATRVPIAYLENLRELDHVSEYAWGAAGLAYLYRQLGVASRKGTVQIAGYLTLLEAWIYEHFPLARPHETKGYKESDPRACRWSPKSQHRGDSNSVRSLRERLDVITSHEINWDPYAAHRCWSPFSDAFFYRGCLMFGNIIEAYHPERVLRQGGHVQTVPRDPVRPSKLKMGRDAKNYMVVYKWSAEDFEQWDDHLLGKKSRGMKSIRDDHAHPNYLEWFKTITHHTVVNPMHRHYRSEGAYDKHLSQIFHRLIELLL